MRSIPLSLLAVSLALFAAAPPVLANEAKPDSGTQLQIKVGECAFVTIKGFAGCKFDVNANSSQSGIVELSEPATQKPTHKLKIQGMSVGTTMVTFTTRNSTNPGCQGFSFMYPVTVSANPEAFDKQAKGKIKDAAKEIKDAQNDFVEFFCDELNLLLEDAKAGEVSTAEALDEFLTFTQSAIDSMSNGTNDGLNSFADDLDARAESFGITSFDQIAPSLLPGGCGDWDKLESGALKNALKAIDKILKKAKKFGKDLDALDEKNGGDGVTVLLYPANILVGQEAPPIGGFVNPPPPPPLPKPLQRSWRASGRLLDQMNGRAHIGGTADPGAGQVTVTVTGPGGAMTTVMADVDAVTCKWTAKFPDLPKGPYNVSVTQGANGPVTSTMAVP